MFFVYIRRFIVLFVLTDNQHLLYKIKNNLTSWKFYNLLKINAVSYQELIVKLSNEHRELQNPYIRYISDRYL